MGSSQPGPVLRDRSSWLDGEPVPDNPANSEPSDWLDVGPWSVPAKQRQIALLAAVAEMIDRTSSGIWSEDLATVLASW